MIDDRSSVAEDEPVRSESGPFRTAGLVVLAVLWELVLAVLGRFVGGLIFAAVIVGLWIVVFKRFVDW